MFRVKLFLMLSCALLQTGAALLKVLKSLVSIQVVMTKLESRSTDRRVQEISAYSHIGAVFENGLVALNHQNNIVPNFISGFNFAKFADGGFDYLVK